MTRAFLPSLAVAAAVATLSSTPSIVVAHQMLIAPEPFFLVDGKDAQWAPLAFLENQKFNTSADFNGYLKQKGYATLRAFMDDEKLYTVNVDALFECGYTDPTYESQPIPTNSQIRSTGYTHDGPCEVWLDDVKVMSGSNCHTEFPGKTFKIDYSTCKGSCTLRWYWLGVRFLKNKYSWQVYKECVALSDKPTATTTAPASTTKAPAAKTPAATTKTPATTTKAPLATIKSPIIKTPAPTTKTPAPAATTKAPAATADTGSVGNEGSYDSSSSTIPTSVPKCSVKKN
ncbi:hypothetical protein Gpo141_00009791 [Globisporangium polare]